MPGWKQSSGGLRDCDRWNRKLRFDPGDPSAMPPVFQVPTAARSALALWLAGFLAVAAAAQEPAPRFKVIAVYTGKEDPAHITSVSEASRWFPTIARRYAFTYETTTDWS